MWKDADDNDCSATIYWKAYENGSYTDLQSATTIDTSASSVGLDVIFDGYTYVTAIYYADAESEPQSLSSTTLKKASDGTWTVMVGGSPVTVADGSNIQVFYTPTSGSGYTPPTPAPTGIPKPETEKTVTANDDGTYTIQLDIEGHEDQEVKQVGANVIVIMDITQSMTNDMPEDPDNPDDESITRMEAAKRALNTLITTLDPDTNLINFRAVNFANFQSNNQGTCQNYWMLTL